MDSADEPEQHSPETLILTERQTPKGRLVAVCDRDVLGETFEARDQDVTLAVTTDFYGTEADVADDETVLESLAGASVANLVGDHAVALAIDAGYVNDGNVLELEGTRHAQFLRL